MAHSGDVIMLSSGTYAGGVLVPEDRPGITIRGIDRNEVVFDGQDTRPSAVVVRADHVTLENFTAHSFTGNAIQWVDVAGFRGRFLTVWNVGGYGVFAEGSRGGRLDHDLSSGAGNSAFYIGECNPCDTVLTNLVARFSAIGYSGTNASGGLVVRNSLWERNGTGILPNSYNEEAHPPQQRAVFIGNTVRASGAVPTPATDPLGGFIGIGIGIAGGQRDMVSGNLVTESARYGIALFPTLQRGGAAWRPSGNIVRANTVRSSGAADLAVAEGSGAGNCFFGNRFSSSLPEGVERRLPCKPGSHSGLAGDVSVARELAVPAPVAYARSGPRPVYRDMMPPGPQPNMPGSDREVSR
jgi:parallel beta helix pectate lyase-like protein